MRLYLDDDSADPLLVRLLKQAGHDVLLPADIGLKGAEDPVHLTRAIRELRVLLTGNYDDFEDLHDLLMQGRGHHPGVIVVRRDNNPRRDLTTQLLSQRLEVLPVPCQLAWQEHKVDG